MRRGGLYEVKLSPVCVCENCCLYYNYSSLVPPPLKNWLMVDGCIVTFIRLQCIPPLINSPPSLPLTSPLSGHYREWKSISSPWEGGA